MVMKQLFFGEGNCFINSILVCFGCFLEFSELINLDNKTNYCNNCNIGINMLIEEILNEPIGAHPIISSCPHLGQSSTWMGSLPRGFRVFSPMLGFLQAGQVTGTGLSQAVKSHLG